MTSGRPKEFAITGGSARARLRPWQKLPEPFLRLFSMPDEHERLGGVITLGAASSN
jgi:hypothetical protein